MSTNAPGREEKLSLATKFFFGAGDIYGGGAFVVVGFFYLFFLTEVAGLNPSLAGLIFMIGKAWDAVSDPLMGYLSDRTRSRFGRRRVYFLAGIIPIVLTFTLLWTVPPFVSQWGTFFYFVLMTLMFNTVITMVMVPYNAIIPELTSDYHERSSLTGFRMAFSNIASLIGAALPPIIVEQFAGLQLGYRAMGLIFGLFFALPWLGVFWFTFERRSEAVRQSGFTLFQDAAGTMANYSFRILVGIYLLTYLAVDVVMAVMVYFLTYITGIVGFTQSLVLGLLLFFQILALFFYVHVAKSYSKRTAYLLGAALWFCLLPVLFFFGAGTPLWMVLALAALIGIGTSGTGFSPWAMLPDVLDVDLMVTGKQRQGVYSGVMTFMRKISSALAIFIVGWIIELSGYVNPPTEGEIIAQPDSFILAVRCLVVILPLVLILLAVLFARRYPLTPEQYNLVRQEISRQAEARSHGLSSQGVELARTLFGPVPEAGLRAEEAKRA